MKIKYLFSLYLGEPLNILEPFIASSSNYVTVTISVFAILFLVSDMPYNAADDSFVLMRISKRKWLCAKLVYMVMSCVIFYLFIALLGMLILSPFSFVGDIWSNCAKMMNYDNPLLSVKLFGVSFYAPNVLSSLSPFQAFISSYALVVLYSVTLCMILVNFKIIISHQYISLSIVYVIHSFGYLPLLMIMGIRPFSLFANSLLSYHELKNANGTMSSPTLNTSYLLFLGIIVFCFLLSEGVISLKCFNRGGKNE